ncbi:MAG: methyltransferase domain-containing protein [Alphaproteobacteria bacterium]|nr:methyltransferase domain-containing protein [Alphaproteobacteria bacterium]
MSEAQAVQLDEIELQNCEDLLAKGKTKDAIKAYAKIMNKAPDAYHLWVNYSSFLFRCGQYEETIKMARKSIEIQPSPEGYQNLGSAQQRLGLIDEAVDSYKKALHINPNFMNPHIDLGVIYNALKQYDRAIDHLQILAIQHPDNITMWQNLARYRFNAGRYYEALSAARQAHSLDPKDKHTPGVYGQIFRAFQDFDINSQLVYDVTTCLQSSNSDPNMFKAIAYKLFLQQPLVQKLAKVVYNYRIPNADTLLLDNSLNWVVLNHPAFVEMNKKIETCNVPFENMFTALRFLMLDKIVNQQPIICPSWPEHLTFISALACQCFLNEYVFFEDYEEVELLEKLKTRLTDKNHIPKPEEIAIYGCYRRLMELENIEDLIKNTTSDNQTFKHLITVQVNEPLIEEEIKQKIPHVTTIDDEISQIVQKQYEENPYPRWIQTADFPVVTFRDYMGHFMPFLKNEDFTTINAQKPDVLIAGCGTGRQIAYVGHCYEYNSIYAIDLSPASLAYAARKMKEKGFENIQYGIGDVLNMRDLNKQFDIVSCTGVLHHMSDPQAGLNALIDCVKPGGFMQLAVYSEIARKHVIEGIKVIAEQEFDYDVQGIRACREYIKALPENDPLKEAMNSIDFYTTSMLRDLLFHFQEHRYTCLQLKEMLESANLSFLGFYFSNPKTRESYKAAYPKDQYAQNLENWHEFEKQNPHAFKEMYQFWVQKL